MDEILKKDIVSGLGIDTLPDEKQEEILLAIGDTIFQAVVTRILEELSQRDQTKFLELLSKQSKEKKLMPFLQAKVPNLDSLIREEVAQFKEETLQIMSELAI